MRAALKTLAILACLVVSSWAGAGEPVTIALLKFECKGGISPAKAEILSDLLSMEMGKLGEVRIVTQTELGAMLNLEEQKRLTGCDDEQCLIEVGGAFGLRWVVTGIFSEFEGVHIINLKLLDMMNGEVVSRVSRHIRGGAARLLAEMPQLAQELLERVASRIGLSIPDRVTSAARHSQPLTESPSAITIITREDIEASGATSIADLLRTVPGMDVAQGSPFHTGITTRTFWTYENLYFLVLIDGRETNIELLGQPHFMSQPVFLEDIERIEVMRGTGSVLYGANAVAGVVSITTRAIQERSSGMVRLTGGEKATRIVESQASIRYGSWGFSLGGGADGMGLMANPRLEGRLVEKVRAVAEYRFSASERLLLDAGFSSSSGPIGASMGTITGRILSLPTRLAYETATLKAHLVYSPLAGRGILNAPIVYAGIPLARFSDVSMTAHLLDAEIQWTLPDLPEPLMLIVGGRARLSTFASPSLLDSQAFANPESGRYHKPGLSYREERGALFLHGELAPDDWMKITAGARVDRDSVVGTTLSARLAAVARVAEGQFLRLGAARAFRMPAFFETRLNPNALFPEDSPFQGESQQNRFREFLTRVGGNPALDSEKIVSLEAGYRGSFLDKTVNASLELFFSHFADEIQLHGQMVNTELGLPDLDKSSYRFSNMPGARYFLGGELALTFSPSRFLSMTASWSYRETFQAATWKSEDDSPKNLLTLGGRFKLASGLTGSLYLHARSRFTEWWVENPAGILEPFLVQRRPDTCLVIGKVGYRWTLPQFELEAGINLYLPISPWQEPRYHYYDVGGGETPFGVHYGGDQLSRVITAYLQGAF